MAEVALHVSTNLGSVPAKPRQRLLRRLAAISIAAVVVIEAVLARSVLSTAASSVGAVSVRWWSVLVALWLVSTLVRVGLVRWSLPKVGWGTSLVMSEAGEAANWLPTGNAGSFAARVAVGRARGHRPPELGVSFALTNEGLATGLWVRLRAFLSVSHEYWPRRRCNPRRPGLLDRHSGLGQCDPTTTK